MMKDHTPQAGARLPVQAGESIDRTQVIEFTFDGCRYTAHPGDTLASALTAAGVRVLSRSFKYHRPRGLLCGAGHCPNCLVQIGDEPNVRSCAREVEPGMEVRSQNAWPSLRRDVMAAIQPPARFMPVGFYYKTFIRPAWMWPHYERFLRSAAGLGKVDPEARSDSFDKQYLHADVVVVGAGPAGLEAAKAAAAQGARVLLLEQESSPGGHVRYRPGGVAACPAVEEACARIEHDAGGRIEVLMGTTVVGWYTGNWLAAVGEAPAGAQKRLYKIRAGAVVVATGAYELPAVFSDNDLPGVMLGSAVRRLVSLHAVMPGRRVVIVAANDDGWILANQLLAAGVEVVALAEKRRVEEVGVPAEREAVEQAGVGVHYRHTIVAAKGKGAVAAAVLCSMEREPLSRIEVPCDSIIVSTAWAPANELVLMAGGRGRFDAARAEWMADCPDGMFTAGRCNGHHDIDAGIADGRRAGVAAARFVSGQPGSEDEVGEASQSRSSVGGCATPSSQSGKRFVCYCEDVVEGDLETAMQEGFTSMELVKRYTTVSMGPCQGRMCSANAIQLCAEAQSKPVQEMGRTTARPPVVPVSIGALAGQRMEPRQLSPLHAWHAKRGAQMMVAGLWLRPHHYGDPAAEVRAVRECAGVIDVSPLGKLRLTGPGVPGLLERLYVNEWSNLRRGRVRYGIMCNDEGVVLDDGVCARIGESEWYLTTTSSGASAITEWMEWWMQSGWGEGVHLEDLTEVNAAFNLAGPRSREILAKLTDRDLANDKLAYMRVRSASVAGVPCRILRIGFTGELSYEIHCPAGYAKAVWEALFEVGVDQGLSPFGVEAQRVLRLEKGHIIVGQDTDALSDPISADAGWAVKLEKPDFLGKRELVRIASNGPRDKLVGFKMDRPDPVPDEGMQIVVASLAR
jgi:sarcosine oxidase subunit alpha